MSAICNNCPGYAGCALNPDGMPCKRRRKELGYYPNNADRIRDMSNEELAKMIVGIRDCSGDCPIGADEKRCYGICDTPEHLVAWLTQPAQKGDGA